MSTKQFENPATWLTTTIEQFVTQSPQNSLQNIASETAFDKPLVGFSKGDDPLYEDYKEHVGPFHWTPMEIFQQTFPEVSASPEELTVISWILPQTAATKADNQKQTKWPAERWARARMAMLCALTTAVMAATSRAADDATPSPIGASLQTRMLAPRARRLHARSFWST